jgi:hypothetical protein
VSGEVESSHIVGQSSGNIAISSKHDQHGYKRNKHSQWSLILGCVSFPSSVLYLLQMIESKIYGGESDFQGALCCPFFMMDMAPVGLVSVVFGILGLVEISKKKTEYGKGFALAGIILGLPGTYIILSILYTLLT